MASLQFHGSASVEIFIEKALCELDSLSYKTTDDNGYNLSLSKALMSSAFAREQQKSLRYCGCMCSLIGLSLFAVLVCSMFGSMSTELETLS